MEGVKFDFAGRTAIVARAVLFLASDASSYISVDCPKVDAGYSVGW